MVDKKLKERRSLLIISILLAILTISLSLKLFFLGLIGLVLGLVFLNNTNYAIAFGLFILPFIPDKLVILYMIFLVGLFILDLLLKEDKKIHSMPLDLVVVVFIVLIVISTLTSINRAGSFRDLAIHLAAIGGMLVMVSSVDSKKALNFIISCLVISASLVALYGLLQTRMGIVVDKAWVDVENNPDMRARVYSVFYNPNILAEYLIMIIPLSVGLMWQSRKLGKKVFYLACTGIMVLALGLTMSRGGWLGFLMSGLVFIVLVKKSLLVLALPGLLGLVYLLPQSIIDRLTSIGNLADSSNAYRLKIWSISLDMIRDNFLVGVGFGHLPFKNVFESYIRTMPISHAHNSYIEVMAEMGIVGLIIFLAFIFIMIKYGYKYTIKSEDRYISVMGGACLAGIIGLLTQGLVENVLYMTKITTSFWFLVGILFTLCKLEMRKGRYE